MMIFCSEGHNTNTYNPDFDFLSGAEALHVDDWDDSQDKKFISQVVGKIGVKSYSKWRINKVDSGHGRGGEFWLVQRKFRGRMFSAKVANVGALSQSKIEDAVCHLVEKIADQQLSQC